MRYAYLKKKLREIVENTRTDEQFEYRNTGMYKLRVQPAAGFSWLFKINGSVYVARNAIPSTFGFFFQPYTVSGVYLQFAIERRNVETNHFPSGMTTISVRSRAPTRIEFLKSRQLRQIVGSFKWKSEKNKHVLLALHHALDGT